MLIGYARNTKTDVELIRDIQFEALLTAGVAPENIYEELSRLRGNTHVQVDTVLRALRSGDTLVVWQLDRLCRDVRHAITVYQHLILRDIRLEVLTGAGTAISTSRLAEATVPQAFRALAELNKQTAEERAHRCATARVRADTHGQDARQPSVARRK